MGIGIINANTHERIEFIFSYNNGLLKSVETVLKDRKVKQRCVVRASSRINKWSLILFIPCISGCQCTWMLPSLEILACMSVCAHMHACVLPAQKKSFYLVWAKVKSFVCQNPDEFIAAMSKNLGRSCWVWLHHSWLTASSSNLKNRSDDRRCMLLLSERAHACWRLQEEHLCGCVAAKISGFYTCDVEVPHFKEDGGWKTWMCLQSSVSKKNTYFFVSYFFHPDIAFQWWMLIVFAYSFIKKKQKTNKQ